MNKELNGLQEAIDPAHAFKLVLEAYANGEITIEKTETYQDAQPKENHEWHTILFIQGDQCIYDGAYELSLEAKDKFKGGQLTRFLLYQLSTQLT